MKRYLVKEIDTKTGHAVCSSFDNFKDANICACYQALYTSNRIVVIDNNTGKEMRGLWEEV